MVIALRWSESNLFSPPGTLGISTTARWIQSLPRTRKRNGVDFWMLKYTPSCHRVLQFAQNPTSEIHWIVWENFKLIWRERLSSMPGNIDGSGLGAWSADYTGGVNYVPLPWIFLAAKAFAQSTQLNQETPLASTWFGIFCATAVYARFDHCPGYF